MLGNILRAGAVPAVTEKSVQRLKLRGDKRVALAMAEFREDKRVPLKPGDWLRCSGLPKMCPRMFALFVRDAIPSGITVDGELNFTFGFGTAVHRQFQDEWLQECLPEGVFQGWWRDQGTGAVVRGEAIANPEPLSHKWCPRPKDGKEYLYKELEFKLTEFRLTGHKDGALVWPDRTEVLEIKTINENGFSQVSGGFAEPKVDHVLQAQAYMWLSGIEFARILYFRKKFGPLQDMLCEHVIERDEKAIDQIKQLLLDSADAIDCKRGVEDFERLSDCRTTASPRAKYCDAKVLCFR